MKNIIIVLLLVAAAGLGALTLYQRNQLGRVREQLASAHNDLKTAQEALKERDEADAKVSYAEKKAKILQETLSEASTAAAKQSEQVSQLQQSLEAAKTNAENKGLAGLLKDPDMKEMIKAQQKVALGTMIDKMYADFLQQSGMTPELNAQFRDLLQKKMMVGAEMGLALLDGSLDSAKRADLAKQMKEQTDAVDAEIKNLLGEDKFKEYQTYEKSAGDRVLLGQFRDQMAGTGHAMDAGQVQSLLDAMQQETTAFKWTTNPSKFENPGETDYTELFNEERLAKLASEKQALDAQILERARQILTPEQLKQFEQFQANQRQLQIAAMKIAGKMFGPKSQ